jgi:predicted O-methyltransferase YrrM
MSSRTIQMTDRLYDYLLKVSLREPPLLAALRAETAKLPMAGMQISPEQGQFMALLAELIGARRAIEVGTFTGYSALCVAQALPPDGKLIACDISEEFTSVARRYWAKAGLADRIELRLAPALDTLKSLLAGGGAGSFDFAFIDADKTQYDAYYEAILKLLRPSGLITIDNVLWSGAVADGRKRDADTVALRALNEKLRTDKRISLSMLPIGDGLTLVRKR